nr:putative ribonuclease H-like domain-containing protein [Tanacetum cinerariifolium]
MYAKVIEISSGIEELECTSIEELESSSKSKLESSSTEDDSDDDEFSSSSVGLVTCTPVSTKKSFSDEVKGLAPDEFAAHNDLVQTLHRIQVLHNGAATTLKQVILNGDLPPPTRSVDGVEKTYPLTTVEEKLARKNELKARGTLLMALPNKHQLKFNSYKNAKSLMEAIEKRFGVKTTHGVSFVNSKTNASKLPNVDSLSDAVIYSFFTSQSNSLQLDSKDLKQIDLDDLEEMDLEWQMAMLTMRAKRFLKKTGRNLAVNEIDTIGFDRTKGGNKKDVPVENTTSNALVSQCDGLAMIRVTRLKKDLPILHLWPILLQTQTLRAYKAGLECVEARLEVYKKNEAIFEEGIKILKLDVMSRDNALTKLRKKFEKAKKEKDDLKLTLEKFKCSSKNLSRLLGCQLCDKSKTMYGMIVKDLIVKYVIVSESVTSVPSVATSKAKTSKTKPKSVNEPLIEDWVSDNEDENESKSKQIKPSFAKIEFVKPTEHVKSLRKSVMQEENHRQTKYHRQNSQSPRGERFIDSRYSRHMTGNMSYLYEYEEIDGGYVAFGGDPKGGKITGRRKTKGVKALGKKDGDVPSLVVLKIHQEKDATINNTNNNTNNITTVSLNVNAAGIEDNDHLDQTLCMQYVYVPDFKSHLRDSPFELVAHTDSDYARASLDRKSTTGGCQFLRSILISWQCKKQTVVATSRTEAEYVAVTINEDIQLRALVDGKKIIVNESSIRRDLKLEDAEGNACLPNDTIFEELARMGTMASAIICLDNNQKFKFSKYIFQSMVKNLENMNTFWMYPRFVQVFVNQQFGDMSHHKKIFVNPSLTKKLFGNMKMEGKGFFEGRMNKEEMFRVNDLDGNEVIMDATASENVDQSAKVTKKEVSTADPVTTAGVEVSTVKLTTAATTPQISKDELTLAQTLIEINVAKVITNVATTTTTAVTRPKPRGVIVQKPSEFRTTPSLQPSQLPKVKDKAELEEEERLARQKEEKDNIALIESWDNIQAMMDADYELAARLQEEERGELTIEKKSRLCVEFMDKRKNYFTRLRAEKIRSKC